ncbi:MAG: hypothetical protein Q4D54_06355 [Eubacteriales bacterium]|nr:hypothetical protein [Eubacteriales bacterium]
MDKILYTKCSLERKKEYKIITSILETDGKRHVRKKAATKDAVLHINRMFEYYKAQCGRGYKLLPAPCKMIESGQLDFEYIEGKTIQSIMQEHYEASNREALILDFETLYMLITESVTTEPFGETDDFVLMFGKQDALYGRPAVCNRNIDIIAENIICSNDCYYEIDYEWVMPFFVPLDYILFRVLYFNVVFQSLTEKDKEHIIDIFHLNRNDFEMFYEMEKTFQKQISLDQLYVSMGEPLYYINDAMMSHSMNHIEVLSTDGKVLFEDKTIHYENKVLLDVSSVDVIILHPCEKRCVIKLRKIIVDGEDYKEDVSSNTVLQIVDDYYFGDRPEFVFPVKNVNKIEIWFQILEKDNSFLPNYAIALKDAHKYELESMGLANDKKVYQEAADEFRDKYLKTNEELCARSAELSKMNEMCDAQGEELSRIKDARFWKIYAKINKL